MYTVRIKEICTKFDINIKIPRIINKHDHETKVTIDLAELYYGVSFYISFSSIIK